MTRRRRQRLLTPEEASIWATVARSTRRLRRSAGDAADLPPERDEAEQALPPQRALAERELPASGGPAVAVEPAPAPRRAPAAGRGTQPATRLDLAPDPATLARAQPPQIDRRRFDRMMRGKLRPEARIDLHGMTRDAAHRALVDFVLSAQARGLRLVLVITGKGRPDTGDTVIPERQGILRHSVPHWLAAPPLTGRVAECRPAHLRHGGAGALYLYLRRRS